RAVAAGADPHWIARTHYDSNSLGRVRIFGSVLTGMTMHADDRVAVLSITQATLSALGGTYDDTEGLINFPLTVKDIQAVAFFKEMGPDDWRVSLRSKGPVDTAGIARQFGGGGHMNASGCGWQGSLEGGRSLFARLLAQRVSP
ncbi:MAG: DHHA1 domain-containing protein, partial [Acidobacteriota bacterium]|nr:DHHA1 domain-containing protein [Acidobacteriota bacterium]